MCQECARRGWQALCGELEDLLPWLVQCIRKPGQDCEWKACQWYCAMRVEVFIEGEKQNSKWQGSQTWDSAACCNKSQSCETGAGKRKEIYSSASISRRWRTSPSPQKPIFPSQSRPGVWTKEENEKQDKETRERHVGNPSLQGIKWRDRPEGLLLPKVSSPISALSLQIHSFTVVTCGFLKLAQGIPFLTQPFFFKL